MKPKCGRITSEDSEGTLETTVWVDIGEVGTLKESGSNISTGSSTEHRTTTPQRNIRHGVLCDFHGLKLSFVV